MEKSLWSLVSCLALNFGYGWLSSPSRIRFFSLFKASKYDLDLIWNLYYINVVLCFSQSTSQTWRLSNRNLISPHYSNSNKSLVNKFEMESKQLFGKLAHNLPTLAHLTPCWPSTDSAHSFFKIIVYKGCK